MSSKSVLMIGQYDAMANDYDWLFSDHDIRKGVAINLPAAARLAHRRSPFRSTEGERWVESRAARIEPAARLFRPCLVQNLDRGLYELGLEVPAKQRWA